MVKAWLDLAFDAAHLGFEMQQVVGLRMIKFACGMDGCEAEAERMVAEKTVAMTEAALILAAGGSASEVVERYRTHVRANRKRLLAR